MNKSKIPLKNYVILFIILILTVLFVYYLSLWYKATKDYSSSASVLSNYMYNISNDELQSFLVDNPEIIIYYKASNVESDSKFDKKLKSIITKNDVTMKLLYLDSDEVSIGNMTLNSASSPVLVYIHNGRIKQRLHITGNTTKKDILLFLRNCGALLND